MCSYFDWNILGYCVDPAGVIATTTVVLVGLVFFVLFPYMFYQDWKSGQRRLARIAALPPVKPGQEFHICYVNRLGCELVVDEILDDGSYKTALCHYEIHLPSDAKDAEINFVPGEARIFVEYKIGEKAYSLVFPVDRFPDALDAYYVDASYAVTV